MCSCEGFGVGVRRKRNGWLVGSRPMMMVKPLHHKPYTQCRREGHEQDGGKNKERRHPGGGTRSTFAWRKEKEGRTSERGWPRRGNEQASSLLLFACLVIPPWTSSSSTLTLTMYSSSVCWCCAGWGAGWWRSAAAIRLSIRRGRRPHRLIDPCL